MVKKGDTLIEVALAIGIFSMVAIAVVAVMSGGTSSSQTALETTLAREEIDAQAEALRFIHSAYLADEYSGDAVYASLWNDIISNAIEIGQNGIDASVLQYNPTTCEDIRENSNLSSKAFVINTHALATDPSKAYVTGDFLQPASTYPRLIYDHAPDTESLIDSATISSADLYRAEGIYVIAVKDPGNTQMVSGDSSQVSATSAYYDFYIRTCWYGAGADQASTISTVVRLYSPQSSANQGNINSDRWTVIYNGNGGPGGEVDYQYLYRDSETKAVKNKDTSEWFLFWSTKPNDTETNQNGITYKPGDIIPFPNSTESNRSFTLYAIWKGVFINYDLNGGSGGPNQGRCVGETSCANYQISSVQPTRSGYKFKGWAYDKNATVATVNPGGTINVGLDGATLYAVWVPYYTLIFYNTDGTTQLCSYGQENNNRFQINCNKTLINPGNNQTFQGWSPDDREPFYKNGDTITVPESNNRVLKLYPVWRVSVKFSSEGWAPSSSGVLESCYIFNYDKPTNGYYYAIKKGAWYGSYNIAPADGYAVRSGGKHIEILDRGIINLQGYCYRAANESVSYTIGKNDTFELSANMNTAGMRTHPGGYASITIGPVTATINSSNITSTCQSSAGGSYSFTNGNIINLKIEKHGNDYSVTVNGTVLKSCTVNTTSNVQVKYTMVHNSHYCTELFNVQLTDIDMQRYIKN